MEFGKAFWQVRHIILGFKSKMRSCKAIRKPLILFFVSRSESVGLSEKRVYSSVASKNCFSSSRESADSGIAIDFNIGAKY